MTESSELHHLLGALRQSRAVLELDTAQLCYLVTLRVQAESAGLTSFDEEQLTDLYLQVCELVEADAVNPRKRATHAIQHLRDQRLLRRVDGAGLVRAGEYTLTHLATHIVDFFIEDESLTRESLTVLSAALRSQLGAILVSAQRATTEEQWRLDVLEPLRVAVAALVSGIERRQRGMDGQQEEVRTEITHLLQQDWFAAVDSCELLLEATTRTLRELNEVLLRDTVQLQTLLQEIEQAAAEAGAHGVVIQTQKVQEHLDRVAAWGADRQRAWSDYYDFVQRYLRSVVRLDPERALSQRLRDQLTGWLDAPFALIVAAEPSIRVLRDERAAVPRPPVSRHHADREREPDDVPPDLTPRTLEQRVLTALDQEHDLRLSAILERVLPALPASEQYRCIGRVAALVAERARITTPLERPWVAVLDQGLTVEEWELGPRPGGTS